MATSFAREALYELVWQQPITKLAKQLGLSDVGLAKACRQADIPLPERGHWARQLAGKPATRPALPVRGLGKNAQVVIGGSRYEHHSRTDQEILSMDIPAPPAFEEPLEIVEERARKTIKHIAIPRKLGTPHPEIGKLLAADEERVAKQQKYSYTWDGPLFTSNVERRRLRFLNGIFLRLSQCGCKCSISGREARDVHVQVGDQTVSFSYEQIGAKERHPNRITNPIPENAKLCVKLSWWQPPEGIPTQWEDSAKASLEDQAFDIAVGLLVAGEWLYRSSLVRRHDYLVDRRRELEAKAAEKKREAERNERGRLARIDKEKRDQLLAQATAWRDAATIRAFVAALVAASQAPDRAWAVWALSEADRIDPLMSLSLQDEDAHG